MSVSFWLLLNGDVLAGRTGVGARSEIATLLLLLPFWESPDLPVDERRGDVSSVFWRFLKSLGLCAADSFEKADKSTEASTDSHY